MPGTEVGHENRELNKKDLTLQIEGNTSKLTELKQFNLKHWCQWKGETPSQNDTTEPMNISHGMLF